jgi:hypothetical protein
MSNTTYTQAAYGEAIRRLSAGYVSEFAEFAAQDRRMHDVMMELASEFVEANLPIVREEVARDVASELYLGITVRAV